MVLTWVLIPMELDNKQEVKEDEDQDLEEINLKKEHKKEIIVIERREIKMDHVVVKLNLIKKEALELGVDQEEDQDLEDQEDK
jgi:hypothetical protein